MSKADINAVPMVPMFQYPGNMVNPDTQVLYMAPPPASIEPLVDDSQAEENIQKEAFFRTHSSWVIAHLALQMAVFTFILFYGGVIMFLVNALFFLFGIRGLRQRNACRLLVHFAYSLILLFAVIVITVLSVFYCDSCFFFTIIGIVYIAFMTVCLRKERILIQHLRANRKLCSGDVEQAKPEEQTQQENTPYPVQVPMFMPANAEFGAQSGMPQPYYYPMMMPQQQFVFGAPIAQPMVLQPAGVQGQ
eukprot:TRINITY_DN2518_c0_g1_i2.p1 TRINITY_DN2518_c0_g1~~TRINITY_DN2518_c0_g1_i2.p1  ORF type:complete len:276 (+),score=48.88 TRINITY_DN2518_c0_g1_i2:86-829(+)